MQKNIAESRLAIAVGYQSLRSTENCTAVSFPYIQQGMRLLATPLSAPTEKESCVCDLPFDRAAYYLYEKGACSGMK